MIDGGHHRLSILKFLGYKSATIALHDIDPAFEKFYEYMLDFQRGKTQMYHPLIIGHVLCGRMQEVQIELNLFYQR